MGTRSAIRDHLDLLLLAVLDAAPGHGYAVIKELRRRSADAFNLPEGTIYPALHRLERAGLVIGEWTTEPGRTRKVYRLTDPGRRALKQRREGWNALVTSVDRVLAQGTTA